MSTSTYLLKVGKGEDVLLGRSLQTYYKTTSQSSKTVKGLECVNIYTKKGI